MSVRRIVDIRLESAGKQLDNIISFVTEPKGIFETVDTAVKTFREANRKTVEALFGGGGLMARARRVRPRLLRR